MTCAQSAPKPPAFRLLAIAGSKEQVGNAMYVAKELHGHEIGLMLRDPNHSEVVVRKLACDILESSVPRNVVLIANSVRIPGVPGVQFTSLQATPNNLLSWNASGFFSNSFAGFSAHSLEDLSRPIIRIATYLTYSPIFPTNSKPGAHGVGLELLNLFCAKSHKPVFALGGITPPRIERCLRAGAYGVAGIRLFAPENLGSLIACVNAMDGLSNASKTNQV